VVNADTLSPDGIQARLEELQKELIKKANNKQDYDAIADEIFRLRDQKEQSELDSHHREEAMNRIKELQDFISGQETDITEFDEALVKKLIEKITVLPTTSPWNSSPALQSISKHKQGSSPLNIISSEEPYSFDATLSIMLEYLPPALYMSAKALCTVLSIQLLCEVCI
jgi:hypothetical protein